MWGKKTTVSFHITNSFWPGVWIMTLRCQKFLENSTHILNLLKCQNLVILNFKCHCSVYCNCGKVQKKSTISSRAQNFSYFYSQVSKLNRCCLLLRGQMTVIVGHSTEAAFGEMEALLCGKTNSWNIWLFPKPIGSALKTSHPLWSDSTASFCSDLTWQVLNRSQAHPNPCRLSSHKNTIFTINMTQCLYLYDEVWLKSDERVHQN